MWDHIDKIMTYVPKYLWTLGRCCSGPQKFVDELFAEQDNTQIEDDERLISFRDTLKFMLASVILSVFI